MFALLCVLNYYTMLHSFALMSLPGPAPRGVCLQCTQMNFSAQSISGKRVRGKELRKLYHRIMGCKTSFPVLAVKIGKNGMN